MNTKKYILVLLVVIALFATSLLLYLLQARNNPPISTGGGGTPEPGYLILDGYNVVSNDGSKIKLGAFFSSTQEQNIRTFLRALLFEKEPLAEYSGSVIPGSVDVNYQTSVIQFKVKIQKPNITYTVSYNSLNDDMTVLDEAGQSLRPTINPDGTPFKSFRTSSQLAQ